MSEILLEVSQLCARYGKVEALHNIQLQLQRGNIATVIGPNGAGKSTLLNAIMGALPSRGQILYQGRAIERTSLEQRVLSGIALVPERRELFSSMSVEDNLLLGGFGACVSVIRNRSINWRRFSNYSRASRNDAPNWPAPCPAASGKCWPSAAH